MATTGLLHPSSFMVTNHRKVGAGYAIVLSLANSMDYDIAKNTVLRAYELVTGAFRNYNKSPNRTYMEFARETETLFDRSGS